MSLYRYFDQNWGQNLDIHSDKIFSISGFPNSWISRFLAFLALIASVMIIVVNLHKLSIWVIVLSCVFFLCSLTYAFGRRATIDRQNHDLAFVQSFFDVPVHVEKSTFDHIRKDTETGLLWSVRVIYGVSEDGDCIPLFRGFSPSQLSTLEDLWTELKQEFPERHEEEPSS